MDDEIRKKPKWCKIKIKSAESTGFVWPKQTRCHYLANTVEAPEGKWEGW